MCRRARQRLLSGAPSRARPGPAVQQGLIEMVRDFCDHANAICEQCRLPELLRDWKQKYCGMQFGVYRAR